MKILPILEQISPIVRTRNLKKSLTGDTSEQTNRKPLGQGLGAVVYDNDEHTVNRVGKWRADDSQQHPETMYRSFIDAIIKNPKYDGNPYFPRVYDITDYIDKMGMRKSRYKLERLNHLDDTHIVIAILNKIFGENLDKVLDFYDINYKDIEHVKLQKLVDVLAKEVIKTIIRGNRMGYIVDHKFLEACFILGHSGIPKTRLDIRYANLMYRTGPTGPQLVITDPYV